MSPFGYKRKSGSLAFKSALTPTPDIRVSIHKEYPATRPGLNAHPCPRPLPQFLDRPQFPLPHRAAVQAALLEHGVRSHGGIDGELAFRKPFGFPNK